MLVEDCIFFQLSKASQAGSQYWGKAVGALGLTAVQAMVLNLLGEENQVTSRRLGERARLTSATLTGILDRLEGMELLERLPHPEDRRAVLVCLTPKGSETVDKLGPLLERANREFLEELGDEEKKVLRMALNRLRGQT
jgi:DNA-binding MarR family transcriptional regulator